MGPRRWSGHGLTQIESISRIEPQLPVDRQSLAGSLAPTSELTIEGTNDLDFRKSGIALADRRIPFVSKSGLRALTFLNIGSGMRPKGLSRHPSFERCHVPHTQRVQDR